MSNLTEMIEKEFTFEPFSFENTTVSGVPIYYKHFSFAPCVHIRLRFRYGAYVDPVGKEGVAHFLEHMLFKGNAVLPNEKAIETFKKEYTLDTLNAHTSIFELVIKAKTLPHNFKKVIEVMCSMAAQSSLTAESFAQEKKVITEEAWKHFLNEKYIKHITYLRNQRYIDLPDRLRIESALGWPHTIKEITHEDIVNAQKTYLVKENMEIYIAGNIEGLGSISGIQKDIEEYIVSIPGGDKIIYPYIPSLISRPKINQFVCTYENAGLAEKKQAVLSISWIWARIDKKVGQKNSSKEDRHLAALVLLSELVSDIIFEKLRIDNSWCYSAGADFSFFKDHLRFDMGSNLNPEHVDDATSISIQILEDIVAKKYVDRFNTIQKLEIESSISKERLTNAIIDSATEDMLVADEIVHQTYVLHKWADVTYEDVVAIINTYLTPEHRMIQIIKPNQEKKISWFNKIKNLLGLKI